MSGQNILTGSKLCWEAIFRQGTICRLCPDAILRPDEIFSMDEIGVTVKWSLEKPCLQWKGKRTSLQWSRNDHNCITNGYKRVFASFIFHSVSRNNHVVCGIFIVISRHYDFRPSNEFLTRGRVFQFNLHSNSFLAFIRISQFILGIFHSQFSFALPFILNDFFWISLRWFQSPCHSWIPAAWIKFNSMSISTFLLFAYEAPVTHFSFLSRNTARLAQCKDDMAEDSDSLMWKCPGKRAKM